MAAYGLFIKSPHSFNIRILILPYQWAALGSTVLIILQTCSTVKTDSIWVRNLVGSWILLTRGVHWSEKYELKSSHFFLILDINLLLWYVGVIQGIFLPFNNIFIRGLYFLGLRIFSKNLRDILIYWYDSCVNEILNISETKFEVFTFGFRFGCAFWNFNFTAYHFFLFFYQAIKVACHPKTIFFFGIKLLTIFRNVSLTLSWRRFLWFARNLLQEKVKQ